MEQSGTVEREEGSGDSILRHWETLDANTLAPYIDNMENRFRTVIQRNGGYI